jgi:hypothetical protein
MSGLTHRPYADAFSFKAWHWRQYGLARVVRLLPLTLVKFFTPERRSKNKIGVSEQRNQRWLGYHDERAL